VESEFTRTEAIPVVDDEESFRAGSALSGNHSPPPSWRTSCGGWSASGRPSTDTPFRRSLCS